MTEQTNAAAVPPGPMIATVPGPASPAPLPRIYTNQQAINACYRAAQALDRANLWELLERSDIALMELAQDRSAPYAGPPLDQLPLLSPREREAIRMELLGQIMAQVRWVGQVNAQSGLNLRTGPSPDYPIRRGLAHRATLQILFDEEEWLFVLANGLEGYVHRDYVEPATTTQPPQSRMDTTQLRLWHIWSRHSGLLNTQARRLDIEPEVALAVFLVESSGEAFGPDGRMVIRFENHLFFRYWGEANLDRFRQHFQMDPNVPWLPVGHTWRADPSQPWQPVHGNQDREWAVFEFARSLDEDAALRAISMGAPQIMGFNHQLAGYETPLAMFNAFSSGEARQIEGFFAFLAGRDLAKHLRTQNYLAFAKGYNGSGQAQYYMERLLAALEKCAQLSMSDRSAGDLQSRSAIPQAPSGLTERPEGVDPELFSAWKDHIINSYENNNETFNRILKGFMRPYHTTVWMYRILFAVGVLAFVAAGLLPYLLRSSTPATALGASAVFGGLGVVSFLSYFITRPMHSLERNLQFITWLGIVYNSYWTRTAYAMGHKGGEKDLEDAFQDAVGQINQLIDKKYPDLPEAEVDEEPQSGLRTRGAQVAQDLPEEEGRKRDQVLYEAWRGHMVQGFENNNTMFKLILDGFTRPYQSTVTMYRILFGVGVLAFVAAGVTPYLLQDAPTATAVGAAAIFGGLSVTSFLSYFISRPTQALEENLLFITWLGIVYNTYWTRLTSAVDPDTLQQDLDTATTSAVAEIDRLISKHALLSKRRPSA